MKTGENVNMSINDNLSLYYDKGGNPISLEAWAMLYKDKKYKSIKYTLLDNHVISTVWLGLNVAINPNEVLIFETGVFNPKSGEIEYQDLYDSVENARKGHDEIVETIKLKHLS